MRAGSQEQTFLPHPLALLAVCFALGVALVRFTVLPLKILLACGVTCALITVYSFTKGRARSISLLLALSFFCAGATLMALEKTRVSRERLQRLYADGVIKSGEPVELTGVVERAPEPAPDGFYLTLRAEELRLRDEVRAVSGQVALFIPVRDRRALEEYEALELRYGARLRVMTLLRRMDNFRNPGVSPFTEYLEMRGLDATGTIKSPLLVERLDDERVFLPLAWLYQWRQRMLSEIDGKFSPPTAGVLKAALLGNRHELLRSTAERFREGGTFHVLVISGLHISFIGTMILFLMRRLTKRRVWQFIVPISFLWAYTLAVGAEIAVVRAALMFTVVALAPVLHRRASSLNALGCATLILLVWRPADLFDPSFQLTFLSVLAILIFSWPLIERLRDVGAWRPTSVAPRPPACPRSLRLLGEALFWSEREWRREIERSNYSYKLFKTRWAAHLETLRLQRMLRYAFAAVVVSLSVQLMLLPLLVLYFHRFSFASLILNILVGALMALLSLMALAALLLSQLSAPLALPLFKLAEALNWLMVHSVDPFSGAGIASTRLPEYTGWPAALYFLYYVPLFVMAVALARWKPLARQPPDERQQRSLIVSSKLAAALLTLMFVLTLAHPFSAGRPDGRLRIDFLDVGQGDAALVTMPDGTTLLVDAGGRPQFKEARRGAGGAGEEAVEAFERDTRSIGEAVVSEYLWWRGLDSVDYLLATHADADHMDGLNDVARNFHVRAGIVARAPSFDSEFARFAATMKQWGVPLQLIGRGDLLRFGEVEAEVLWPPHAGSVKAASSNDESIVLRLRFGRRAFLLTGDIERGAEATLAAGLENLRSDVVKVAHHGSRTSSTEAFIKATEASYAIISVGLDSTYGHPHKEILTRWLASGAEVLTTGQRGTITISTDGSDLRVETFVKQ